jgi:hypothetical protein
MHRIRFRVTTMQSNANAKPRKLTAIGWQGRLNEAATGEAVVAAARDYLAALTRTERAQVPEDCRPGALENPQQLLVFALRLAHRHDGDTKAAPALHRLAAFFSRAALRIYQINERSREVASERRAPRKLAGNE